tara:strand:- start:150 stop:398 length:249 start_codon:yes stop_codon:yes gene_type:complete
VNECIEEKRAVRNRNIFIVVMLLLNKIKGLIYFKFFIINYNVAAKIRKIGLVGKALCFSLCCVAFFVIVKEFEKALIRARLE